jgi:hypothetical protein
MKPVQVAAGNEACSGLHANFLIFCLIVNLISLSDRYLWMSVLLNFTAFLPVGDELINVDERMNGRTDEGTDGLTAWYHFNSKCRLCGRLDVDGHNKTYLVINVKCLIFLPDFKQVCILRQFHESLKYYISYKSLQREPRWYMRTDGRKWRS